VQAWVPRWLLLLHRLPIGFLCRPGCLCDNECCTDSRAGGFVPFDGSRPEVSRVISERPCRLSGMLGGRLDVWRHRRESDVPGRPDIVCMFQ